VKTKTAIIIGVISGMLLMAGVLVPVYIFFLKCDTQTATQLDPHKPQKPTVNQGVSDPYSCGDTIDISATMKTARLIEIIAKNKCMSVPREYDLTYTCPFYHHEIMMLFTGAIEYNGTNKKFDFGYGGELIYSYSWGRFGLAGGVGFLKFSDHIDLLAHAGAFYRFGK
jgi:hypothetical protein